MLDHLKHFSRRASRTLLGLSLPAKCALLLLSILTVHSALLLVAGARGHAQMALQQQEVFARQWVKQIAFQSQQGLVNNDRLALLNVLRLHLENPLLRYAQVADSEDKVLVEAGQQADALLQFSAPIRLGQDIAGSVTIALDPKPTAASRRALNLQLLILAGVLSTLAAGLILALTQRIDGLFRQLAGNHLHPSAEPQRVDYAGSDTLGELIKILERREPRLPALATRDIDRIVLHLHWSHYSRLTQQWGRAERERRLERSYRASLALSQLYHGTLNIHRRDGVTLHFDPLNGSDHPLLRALCCAHLLQGIDHNLGARPALGSVRLRGNRFQQEAAEITLVESLAGLEGSGIQARLPGDLNERLAEWAETGDQGLVLHERYRQLLDRQRLKLEEQLSQANGH